MSDWFGETPVEIRESLPSHFEDWEITCDAFFCDQETAVMIDGKYYCWDHASEEFDDSLES